MDYTNLDNAAKMLGVNEVEYLEAKEAFLKDKNSAILKYLGYEDDGEIQVFTDFWFYYLAEYTKNFFHNFESNNFTNVVKNFIITNNIEMNSIDFDDFEKKEKYYSEALFDILLSEIKYNLKNKNLDIFGINVGFSSNIYYILPKNIMKKLKAMNETFKIFDFQMLEKIYGEIYRIKEKLEEYPEIEVGDYIEKNKEKDLFRTLYSVSTGKNIYLENIDKNKLELVL